MSKLQGKVNKLVEYIQEYETNYFSALDNLLTKEQAEDIAAILIDNLCLYKIDDANINSAYNEMLADAYNKMLADAMKPPDNPKFM